MGMAGGAFKGDQERAKLALQAMQIANQRSAQNQADARQQAALAEQRRQADMTDARANRALDIQADQAAANQSLAESRIAMQDATLRERMRANDLADASRQRGLDIREQLAAARQQVADARLAKLVGQNDLFGQFQQVCDVEQKQIKAKQAQGQATMASMMKMGLLKGGTVPMAALNFANRQFGFDGKTQAIGAAGFMSNGNFFIDFLQKDPNNGGAISRNTQVMNYEDFGRVLYSQAGIFDNADRQQWREGMKKRGYSTQEINSMSGLNATMLERLDEAGLQRLDAGYADPTGEADWKSQYTRRMQEIRLERAEQELAKKLGQNGLTPAQKYALYHFNEFATPTAHEATDEDVKAGLAKNKGEQVWTQTSPDQAFQKAVEFYNKNSQNADPAVTPDPDKEGGDPKVVKEPTADPAGTGIEAAPAGDEELPEGGEAPAGGEEAPTDQPEAQQAPVVDDGTGGAAPAGGEAPAEVGQGEFDFGGMAGSDAPEAPADGGEAPAPAEGGEASAEGGGEGGEGAPPPPPEQTAPEAKTIAGGAAGGSAGDGDIPDGEVDATSEVDEDGVSVHNPFAKWVKRSKKNRK